MGYEFSGWFISWWFRQTGLKAIRKMVSCCRGPHERTPNYATRCMCGPKPSGGTGRSLTRSALERFYPFRVYVLVSTLACVSASLHSRCFCLSNSAPSQPIGPAGAYRHARTTAHAPNPRCRGEA